LLALSTNRNAVDNIDHRSSEFQVFKLLKSVQHHVKHIIALMTRLDTLQT
jgi:hypothetical protein